MVNKRITNALIMASILGLPFTVLAQKSINDHDHTHHAHEHVGIVSDHSHGPMQPEQLIRRAKLVTGQGDFVFSYDE